MHAGKRFPAAAVILAAEHVAGALVLDAPCSYVDVTAVLIEDDVVQNVIIFIAKVRQARPLLAAVIGLEQPAGAGAEEDAVRVTRVIGEAANIAAIGADRR